MKKIKKEKSLIARPSVMLVAGVQGVAVEDVKGRSRTPASQLRGR